MKKRLNQVADYFASRPDKENDLVLTAIGIAFFLAVVAAYLSFHQSVMPIK